MFKSYIKSMTGKFILTPPPPHICSEPLSHQPRQSVQGRGARFPCSASLFVSPSSSGADKTMIIKLHYTCTTVRVIGL